MGIYKNYRIPASSLTTTELADGTVAAVDIANDAISTDKLNSAGIAPIISGGSINGQSLGVTRSSAVNALLPTQAAKSGKFLKSDGTNVAFNTNDNITLEVNQTAHGFSLNNAIYHNGTTYAKAQSNAASSLGTMIVTKVVDANNFEATLAGLVTGLTGLTAGEYYFVSNSVAGDLMTTDSAPYSNPLLYAISTTTGIVLPYRPSASVTETTILPNQATANGQYLKSNGSNTLWDAIDISTSDVTGTLTVGKGGTGITTTPTNGQIPIGNGTTYVAAAISGTSNKVVVTNGAGTIGLNIGTDVVTLTDTQSLTNKTLTNPTITNYTETLYAANASAYSTIALTNGTIQKITLNQASTTLTFPAVGSSTGKSFTLYIIQDATGSRTLTWPTSGVVIKWEGAVVPTITSTANKTDIFSFICDESYWYGSIMGQNY